MQRRQPTIRFAVVAAAALVLLWGCNEDVTLQAPPDQPGPTNNSDPLPVDEIETVPVATTEQGRADLFGQPPLIPDPPDDPDPPIEPEPVEPPTRERRRMDIDQLNVAIRQVTGGIGWTEMQGVVEVDLFEALSETLGRPDYLDTTIEVLEPAPLFQKFLDDAARSVCTRRVEEDLIALASERQLMVYVDPYDTVETNNDGVIENLRYLLLRYHGRHLDAESGELLPWHWLFESAVHVTAEPPVAWRTVCVGLLTHPQFYTY